MRSKLAKGAILILLCLLCGCGDSGSDARFENKETATAADDGRDESAGEWTMNDSLSEDEKREREWASQCQSLRESLGALEGVSRITITPADYAAYTAEGAVTVTCTLSGTAQPKLEGEIKNFIDSMNVFDKYELRFD